MRNQVNDFRGESNRSGRGLIRFRFPPGLSTLEEREWISHSLAEHSTLSDLEHAKAALSSLNFQVVIHKFRSPQRRAYRSAYNSRRFTSSQPEKKT